MSTVIVRYKPKADRADDNQALVEAVYAELARTDPGGLKYATFRLADGTFVHVGEVEGDENPLAANSAFQAFQRGIADRCEPGHDPDVQEATVVGSYGLPTDPG